MGIVTNETPENPQSIPPIVPGPVNETGDASAADVPAGQHDFSRTFSSEAVVPDAAPESARPAEPEPVSAPEQMQESAPEPVVAASAAPEYPQAAPGGHEIPSMTATPGAAQAAPAYQAAPPYDPNAAQAYPAGGYPPSAYPGVAPAAPKKPMSKGLLFGIIGGAAALVLLIAAVIVVPSLLRGPAPTASGAVEKYLTALSDGDAETALTFIDTYGDDSLLTDEVLAASLKLAPITDIVVEEPEDASEYEATVSASFAVGGETIEREFTAYSTDDDWVISDGLVSATLANFEGLDVTVNGVTPGDPSTSVFPGTYQLALGFEEFALDSDTDTFTLTTDDDAEPLWDIYPVLTDDGAATFRSLVTAAITECVAMKTLATPCGMDITDIDLTGYTPTEGTVTRTLSSDGQATMDAMEAEVDYSTPTLVSTYDTPTVDMTLQGTKDGTTAEFEVLFGGYMDTPSVDFAEETPTVTWG